MISEGLQKTDYLTDFSIPIKTENLRKLIPLLNGTPKEMSLRSALLGSEVIKSQTIRGKDILKTPGNLIDNLQICYTVNAKVPKIELEEKEIESSSIRYLGFSRGKIRDSITSAENYDGITIDSLIKWYNSIYDLIYSSETGSLVFSRYAPPIDPPPIVIPKYIQLDIDPFNYSLMDSKNSNRIVEIPEESYSIVQNGKKFHFEISIISIDKASDTKLDRYFSHIDPSNR